MSFLGLLLRLAIIYLIVRLIWRALAPPRRPPKPPEKPSKPLGNDIVDAEWVDLDE